MKKVKQHYVHITYAYVIIFSLFVLGVMFVFFFLPNLPEVMQSAVSVEHPQIASHAVAAGF